MRESFLALSHSSHFSPHIGLHLAEAGSTGGRLGKVILDLSR